MMAGHVMGVVVIPQIAKFGIFVATHFVHKRAAWMESATRWGIGRIGHIPLQNDAFPPRFFDWVRDRDG